MAVQYNSGKTTAQINGSISVTQSIPNPPTGGVWKYAVNSTASASDQVLFTTTAAKTAYVVCLNVTRSSADIQPLVVKNHATTTILSLPTNQTCPQTIQPGCAFIQVAASETLIINNNNQGMTTNCIYYEV